MNERNIQNGGNAMNETLEKIIIETEAELKKYEGQNLNNKHLIINFDSENIKLGTLENCQIEGKKLICKKLVKCKLFKMEKVYADKLHLAKFSQCKEIRIGDYSEDNKISASMFFDCDTIMLTDADVDDCIFKNFKTLYLTNCIMENGLVAAIECENDCAISMEDGSISDVSFENISLKNDSYLIEGFGEPWIENCVFLNVRTSREDKEIFHQEETKGKIFKRKKEYSFVDEESCSGLNLIMNSDGEFELYK